MIHQSNDPSILHQVATGNESAFKELFQLWHPFLTSHIFRITESKELTEEIVHDVFIKIWLTRETLESIDNFKAYLIVVSRNQALNALRKIATEAKKYEAYVKEHTKEGEAYYKGIEVTDSNSLFYSLIDEAIDSLSERQREIYLMHRHQQLTYNEIASQLNLSRETIKTHLQNSNANITKYIKQRIDF